MDLSLIYMDKPIMTKYRIYKEERFRTPLATERTIGLWVDRIGSGLDTGQPRQLRILGQYALVRVKKGSGAFFSPATGRLAVQSNQAMILFPDEPNTYYPDDQWTTEWIVWNGPEAKVLENLGYLARRNPVVPDPLDLAGRAHVRLSQIITAEDLASVLERKNIVLQMILDLYKSVRPAAHPHHDLMENVVAYLSDHYTRNIPIDTLAARFNLSQPHFRRLFKLHTGRTPHEFLTALRISKAKEFLSQGKTIKQTAPLVGYHDLFYFMRIFKKTTGLPPGKFIAV